MRYWDIANQIYPEPARPGSDNQWRRAIRRVAEEGFSVVREGAVDPEVAAALAKRSVDGNGHPISAARWRPTLHCIGSLGAGGAERQLVNLLVELADRGHDSQTLLTMHPLEGDGAHYLTLLKSHAVDLRVNNFPIREEGVELIRNNQQTVDLIRRMPASFHAWTLDLWVDIALAKPDIAHFWLDHCNIWGAPAALLAGVPSVVISTRNVHPENFPYLFAPYMRPWYTMLAQCPRVHFINNSHAGADSYADWMGVPRSQFEVIVNGVNLAHLAPATPDERHRIRDSIGVPREAVVVVGAFRMSEEKRPLLFVDTFARAARDRPGLHAVLMGEGTYLEAVKARAAELGLSNRFHALGRRTDLPKVLSSMDIFLHTAWWEGTPNVVLEAQQLQIPVIVAKAGGAAEAVAHGETGYLVERERTEELADRLIEIIEDLPRWKEAASKGPDFIARRFGVQRMVDETFEVHRKGFGSDEPAEQQLKVEA